jgi:hypothetical protein
MVVVCIRLENRRKEGNVWESVVVALLFACVVYAKHVRSQKHVSK